MGANRTYKDSVFSLLFNNPEALRELYGALEGVVLPPDLPITINTLEGALFMVWVININKGHNDGMMRRSKTLEGYSRFIGKAREYERGLGSREEGVKAAVKYRISRGDIKGISGVA